MPPKYIDIQPVKLEAFKGGSKQFCCEAFLGSSNPPWKMLFHLVKWSKVYYSIQLPKYVLNYQLPTKVTFWFTLFAALYLGKVYPYILTQSNKDGKKSVTRKFQHQSLFCVRDFLRNLPCIWIIVVIWNMTKTQIIII